MTSTIADLYEGKQYNIVTAYTHHGIISPGTESDKYPINMISLTQQCQHEYQLEK